MNNNRKKGNLGTDQMSLEHYLAIMDQLPLGIQIFDRDGYSFAMNETQRIFLGVENKSTGIGEFNVLTDPFIVETGTSDLYKRAYNGETIHHTFSINFGSNANEWGTRRDTRTFLEKIAPIYDHEGKVVFVISMMEDKTERLEEERQLYESEERFRAIFKQDKSVKLLINPSTGKIEDANPGAMDFYGYTEEEMKKLSIQDINILSAEEVAAEMERASKLHKNHFHFKHRLANGEIRDVNVYSSPITMGGETKLFSIIHDVTDQERAKRKLQESERRWKFAVEGNHDGLWDWDLQTNKLYYSERWKQMLGYSSDEISDTLEEWSSRVHPDDFDEAYQRVEKHLNGESEYYESEHRIRYKDGSYIWVLDRGMVVDRDENGRPLRMIGTNSDISRRKEAVRRLKESQVKFKTIFQVTNIGLTITDDHGNIIDCNTASEEILGITKEEHLNRKYDGKEWPIIRPNGSKMAPEEFASVRALKENRAINDVEMGVVRPDGIRWISVSASPLDLEGFGVLIGYVDITQRKENENQLKELVATKDKLFSIIAHDMRNPFNLIMGYGELAQSSIQEEDFESVAEYIGFINHAVEQSYNLLDNLLQWSRLQTGRMTFDPQELLVRQEFEEIRTLFQPTLEEKKLTLKLDVESGLTVTADRYMLETILRNLVGNAIKFSFPDSKIVLSAKRDSKRFKCTVTDEGVGIPHKYLTHLFQIGEQISTQGTHSEKGSGLGLILCKEFVERHDGQIWVESEEGKGTTVGFEW